MRNLFCILAILCTIHVSQQDLLDPTNIFQFLVDAQKASTKTVLDDLMSFEKRLNQNIEIRLNDMKYNALLNINNIVDAALQEVKITIEKGKSDGKDVSACEEFAKYKADVQINNAITNLETCVQNSQTIIEVPLQNVRKTIQSATTLLTDLDSIIPNCYSSIFFQMQLCILKELALSKTSLNRLEDNAIEVKDTANIAYTNAINIARSCMTKPVADTRTTSADIIINVSNCVRNADDSSAFLKKGKKVHLT